MSPKKRACALLTGAGMFLDILHGKFLPIWYSSRVPPEISPTLYAEARTPVNVPVVAAYAADPYIGRCMTDRSVGQTHFVGTFDITHLSLQVG